MTTLTKADLIDAITLNPSLSLSRDEATSIVNAVFEEIRSALADGEEVKLSGFGNFSLHNKKERPGRNPKTGKDIPITARRVVSFRAGQKFKARVVKSKPRD